MCDFNEVFDELFPKSWLDPYGKMPMNRGLQTSVDITVEKSDGVTKVTAVKTPPRSDHMSFQDALEMVLSITSSEIEPLTAFHCSDDLGKCKPEDSCENDPKSQKDSSFSDKGQKKFGEDAQDDAEDTVKKNRFSKKEQGPFAS